MDKEKRIHTIGDKDYWYFPKIKNKPNKLDKILKELQEMLITLKKIEDKDLNPKTTWEKKL